MKAEQKSWTRGKGWIEVSSNDLKDKAQLVLLFGDRDLLKDQKLFGEVKGFYPNARIAGCSTAGEILGTQVLDDSLAVTAVHFENTGLQFACRKIDKMENSFKFGEEIAEDLNKKEGLAHVLVLSDGLHVNGSGLAKGLASKLPGNIAVTGGLAGDQSRFEETRAFSDCAPDEDVIGAIGFYGGRLKIGYGSMGGWDSFGPDRTVTRSDGNVLYELDGQSALGLYKEYLGEQAEGLPATGLLYPLSLRLEGGKTVLVRTILGIDEKEGSMTYAGDVPEGASVRLMKANFDRLIDGAAGAANGSRQAIGSSDVDLAVLISCVGRKLVLKQRIEEEVEGVQDVLGADAVMTGFYSYGEICPVVPDEKQCELHNQTMTITTFSEA